MSHYSYMTIPRMEADAVQESTSAAIRRARKIADNLSLRMNSSLENPTVPVPQSSHPSGTMLEAVLPATIPVRVPVRRKTGVFRSNRQIAAPTRSTAL